MRTKFTELVGCDLPIQQAAFGSLSVELVAAVSAAGGLGLIGAPLVSAEVFAAALDVAIERGALVEFFYGAPDHDLVEHVHDGGCLAAWQVGSVADAVAAARCGCDLVVVQGWEAGGHLAGTQPLLPMLCEVLDLVDVPVLAAGGITTPRAFAAVLAAGAAGARIGTALVASDEADFHPEYKRAVLAASGT